MKKDGNKWTIFDCYKAGKFDCLLKLLNLKVTNF